MDERIHPMIVDFPLRGEWLTPNTPGKRIPSHGTNRFGTRYAYDFLQVDWGRWGLPSYRVSFLHYLLLGVPLEAHYCYGQEIYAPCDGVVVRAEDGYPERRRAHPLTDLFVALRSAHQFDAQTQSVQTIAGNYIILKCEENLYAGFVHLQKGSVSIAPGQQIQKGEILGRIGHSGNSFFPHLHFQLMDREDISTANGIPCAFRAYECLRNGRWETVQNGIPNDREHIRFLG